MGIHRASTEGVVGELEKHRLLERPREKGIARMMYRAYMAAIISNAKRLVQGLEEQRTSAAAAWDGPSDAWFHRSRRTVCTH